MEFKHISTEHACLKIAILAEESGDIGFLAAALRQCGYPVSMESPMAPPPPEAQWALVNARSLHGLLEEVAGLRRDLIQAKLEMEERKLVERAKGLLMTRRGMTEPEAYRTIQKLAMDRKRKLADIARTVLDFADLVGGPNDPIR